MKRSKRFRWLRRIMILLVAALLLPLVLGAAAYADVFGHRVQTPASQRCSEAQFPGLQSKAVPFRSEDGVTLAGKLYSCAGKTPVGLVVLAHGMGFGHSAYMNVIAFFASRDYLVFAYDATGYDASEGSSAGGVPQAVSDLDAAMNAAEALPQAAGLPVCLFGHSLGGYAVCAVLPEHPEVRAVAALAGFDSTAALIRARYGLPGALLIPGAVLWERLRFGGTAGRSAMEGFAASDANVLIVHSSDDETVPIACGLDRYAEQYRSDPRFTFLRPEGRGHGALFSDDITTACLELFDGCIQ